MASQHPVVESSEWAYQVREHSAIRGNMVTSLYSSQYPGNRSCTDRRKRRKAGRKICSSPSLSLYQVLNNGILPSSLKSSHEQIGRRLEQDSYTPRTWRTHPLHVVPPEPYDPAHPFTTTVIDWIFLISALNFSFWSPLEGKKERYGVEWYASWDETKKGAKGRRQVFTGYWSLVASLDRGL